MGSFTATLFKMQQPLTDYLTVTFSFETLCFENAVPSITVSPDKFSVSNAPFSISLSTAFSAFTGKFILNETKTTIKTNDKTSF